MLDRFVQSNAILVSYMVGLDKLWSNYGLKRLKTDQALPVYVVPNYLVHQLVPVVRMYVNCVETAAAGKARTTATIITTTATIENSAQETKTIFETRSRNYQVST